MVFMASPPGVGGQGWLAGAMVANRPEAATNFLAINSRKSIMETTAHAQSHLRRHECLAYLTQAFIPASFGDML